MRNPIRNEAEAYRFVLLTAIAFAVITAVAVFGGVVPGLTAWALVTGAAAIFYLRRGRPTRPVGTAPPHRGGEDERRVLVLANNVLADEALVAGTIIEEIQQSTAGYRASVNIVYPLPVSAIRHWASDVDGARAEAERHVENAVGVLRAHGLEARGEVGDEDPLQAIEDSLRTFGADEVLVVTRNDARGNELNPAVVTKARERFALPIAHLVVHTRHAAAPA